MKQQKKVIGIIGGLSPMSTVVYYSQIVECYKSLVGEELQYPRMIVSSLNMAEVDSNRKHCKPSHVLKVFENAAQDLQAADFIVIASNSLHIVADDFASKIDKEFLDIREAVAQELLRRHICKVLLLGTSQTMQKSFYSDFLAQYGISSIVPDSRNQEFLNNLVYDQLCQGNVFPEADELLARIVKETMTQNSVEAVVFACTEFSLLNKNLPLPVIDSTELHVKAIVDKALHG